MKTLFVLIVLVCGIAMTTEPALASCSITTVYLPDGSVRFVQTCCYNGGNCIQTWM